MSRNGDILTNSVSKYDSIQTDRCWKQKKDLMWKHGVTALACAALMAVSSALIILNKHILSHGFPFPMALAGIGMGFSGFASYLTCRVFRFVKIKPRDDVNARFVLTRVMPVGFFSALTLYLGNLAYLYLTVSFIQMLKSLAPVIAMVELFVAGEHIFCTIGS